MIDEKTVPEITLPKFIHLKSWDEIIAYGGQLRQSEDECKWDLGDLAALVCKPVIGRPVKGSEDEEYTVAAFAKGIAETRSVVSELMHNAQFWSKAERLDLPADSSWRQAADARRRSGWRPGEPVTAEHKQHALHLLDLEVDQRAQRGKPSACELLQTDLQHAVNSLLI